MGFPLLLNLPTAALPGQTTKTALTEEFMFQNVAYRPTVYITGSFTTNVIITIYLDNSIVTTSSTVNLYLEIFNTLHYPNHDLPYFQTFIFCLKNDEENTFSIVTGLEPSVLISKV